MKISNGLRYIASGILVLGCCMTAARADEQEQTDSSRVRRIQASGPVQLWMDQDTGPQFFVRRGANAHAFWIGVQCQPNVEGNAAEISEGVEVIGVMDDSPAAKAGLQKGDRIVKIGDADLNAVSQLIQAVQEHGSETMKLTIKRNDESLEIEVTPEKRPQMQFAEDLQMVPGMNPRMMEEIRRLMEQQPGGMGFQFFGPGMVLEDEMDFPGNMSVSVTREGDGPAQIKIEKDGKTYEVDENSLDQLPEDIRPWAERFLGKSAGLGALPKQFRAKVQDLLPGNQRVEVHVEADADVDADSSAKEDRIDQLEKQVRELQKQIQQLKSGNRRM
ncbi:MAG: PDZ domain-containing protein [Planctomycetales bacterium]|nr:PDZ domain-containing protein [Planctomycetales bacterium]